jgi:hypothetical protein
MVVQGQIILRVAAAAEATLELEEAFLFFLVMVELVELEVLFLVLMLEAVALEAQEMATLPKVDLAEAETVL